MDCPWWIWKSEFVSWCERKSILWLCCHWSKPCHVWLFCLMFLRQSNRGYTRSNLKPDTFCLWLGLVKDISIIKKHFLDSIYFYCNYLCENLHPSNGLFLYLVSWIHCSSCWRGPAQYVHFFYALSNASSPKSCKSVYQPFKKNSHCNSQWHNSVIELCRGPNG